MEEIIAGIVAGLSGKNKKSYVFPVMRGHE